MALEEFAFRQWPIKVKIIEESHWILSRYMLAMRISDTCETLDVVRYLQGLYKK